MAVLFGRIRSISRGRGSNAMQSASYRSCSKLTRIITDSETSICAEVTYDYSDKKGLVFSQIFAPSIITNEIEIETPAWIFDRQKLWQRIEDIENRVNSELAKEYIVALPKEFTIEQNIDLLKEFVGGSFVSREMVVDVNYHADNPENPHAHIMFPMRKLEMNEEGEINFGGKERIWKSFAVLNEIKREQQQLINKYYAKHGFEHRLNWGPIDELESTFHHGGMKNLWQLNQEIVERNSSKIIANPSLVIDKLDHNKAVFTKEDIERELTSALQNNVFHIKSQSFAKHQQSLDQYIKIEAMKMLGVVLSSPKLSIVNECDLKGRMLFAKTSQVELEQRFIDHILELKRGKNHVIRIEDKDIASLGLKKEFTKQQKSVIRKTLAGNDISIIEGWPGAGKTTISKEIVRHYQDRGYTVIAIAPTNKAVQELSNKLGVTGYTTCALRMKWQRARGYESGIGLSMDYYKQAEYQEELSQSDDNAASSGDVSIADDSIIDKKTVLIMDEISMIDLPTFDYFASRVLKGGGKLIGLGDNNQNQAIGTKGAAAKAIEIAGSNLLTEVNRHVNSSEEIRDLHIKATSAMSQYQISKAISIYDKLSAIKLSNSEEEKRENIANHYVAKLMELADRDIAKVPESYGKIAMSAYTNDEIDQLNKMVRSSLKEKGILDKHGYKLLSGGVHGKGEMVELCKGDQIIFKSNKREENGYGGVMNNEIATIYAVISSSENGVGEFIADVHREDGYKRVVIRTGDENSPISFRHGYAISNYAIQGIDVDYMLFSVDKNSGYEAMLVFLTRHKIDCQIFAAIDTLNNEVYLTKDMDVARAKAEYEAIAYKYEDTGGDKKEKIDIPLWKIGLKMLAAKRSNLNFAIDYAYTDGHRTFDENNPVYGELNKSILAIKANITNLHEKLEQHLGIISEYEYKVNSPVKSKQQRLKDGRVAIFNIRNEGVKAKDELNNELNNESYNSFELFALQHFEVKCGEIEFDVRGVMSAPEKFKEQCNESEVSSNASRLESNLGEGVNGNQDDEYISAAEHVRILKNGVSKNGDYQKLRWSDLGEIDKDLILYSYLDEEDRELLQKHTDVIAEIESEIKQQGNLIVDIWQELTVSSKETHEKLEGNFAIMRDYLVSRSLAQKAYKEYRAKKIDKDELEEKVNERASCAELVIEAYDRDVANKESNVDQLNKLDSESKSEFESETELESKTRSEAQITTEAQIKTKTKNVSMVKLMSQVGCNYQTIARNARMSEERNYFKKIGKNSIYSDINYIRIMELASKAHYVDLEQYEASEVREAYIELGFKQKACLDRLKDLEIERKTAANQARYDLDKIHEYNTYQFTTFNNYLDKIYKADRLETLEIFTELLSGAEDKDRFVNELIEKPQLLGALKSHGLIAKIFKNAEQREFEEQMGLFAERIKVYVEGKYGHEMQAVRERNHKGKYQETLDKINKEIANLREGLANEDERHLMQEIYKAQIASVKSGVICDEEYCKNINKLFREDEIFDVL